MYGYTRDRAITLGVLISTQQCTLSQLGTLGKGAFLTALPFIVPERPQ